MPRIDYSSDSSLLNDTNDNTNYIFTVAEENRDSTEDLSPTDKVTERVPEPKQKIPQIIPRSWVYDHDEKKE